jgi:hypothetical protein
MSAINSSQRGNNMSNCTLATIDRALLVSATGGAAAPPPSGRTWGQVGRDYAAACVGGATTSLVSGGRPTSWRDAAGRAAVGCAVGVGQQAVTDLTGGGR